MSLREPLSADECVYLTNRFLDDDGSVMCWVFKKTCDKCGKAQMGKPKGPNGKVKIRAKQYVCPACNNATEKVAYEESLTANIRYICPKCVHPGELQIPFKRKKIDGVPALAFACQKCKEKIYVTKKMKEIDDGESEDDE